MPHLGRVGPLDEVGRGAAGVVMRVGEVGVKIAGDVARLRREAIVRAVLGQRGAPLDGLRLEGGGALAFRFVDGTPLDRLEPARVDGVRLLNALLRDLAGALARLHRLGFRHGDVKPSNVVVALGANGAITASLIDLGLAAPFEEPFSGGTPAFLAPELQQGATRLGAEADVFAFGRLVERTAERFSLAMPEGLVRLATASRPGERPTAASIAGFWSHTPLDAAYVRTRLVEIERAAERGASAPEGLARPWTEGLMRAIAGLSGRRAEGPPLPALDRRARRALLAEVAGAASSHWTLPARLEEEQALLAALIAHGDRAPSPRSLAAATRDAVPSSDALARLALDPADEDALAALERLEGNTHAAIALLRRAGRLAEARAMAETAVRSGADPSSALLDLAEVARAAGDREGARKALARMGDDPRVLAPSIRIALDEGDTTTADQLLARAADDDRGALAEVRALRAWTASRFDDALEALDRATDESLEQRARNLIVRGMALHGRGDAASALRAFSRAGDLALAMAAIPLEASARASAAAAGHDDGRFAEALEAATRATELLLQLDRAGDAARARLTRAATLVALGATTEGVHEARRIWSDPAADPRARAYARWVEIDARLLEPTLHDDARVLAEEARRALGDDASEADRLQQSAYEILTGSTLDDRARAPLDRMARTIEPASARWTWGRARLSIPSADGTLVDDVLRWSDHEAPPSLVGPVLALAGDRARTLGRGDAARTLHERLATLVTRIAQHVPPAMRASFDALPWVAAASSNAARADDLGLGAGQIDLLAAITRGLRDRTSLADLLRQVVDGLVLWVGVERGLLLLRAPGEGAPRLVPRVARGIAREDLRGEQLALSTTLASRALSTLEPVVAVDAAGESSSDVESSIHALRLRSVLAVPLVARGEALGVVYLDDRIRRGAFGPREVAWVRLLATQAAAAIADARDALRLRRLARRAERAQQRLEAHLAKTEGALEIARAELARAPRPSRVGGDPRGTRHRYDAIIGDGTAIRRMLSLVDRVTDAADSRIPVLVFGESGSGKELVARAIHDNGPRKARAFVAENCGAIPETLLESTLFGHVRGAFTGAERTRVGLFEIAHGGTLLLDEIGEMGTAMQAKLLRVLQEGEIRPVGAERSIKVDVRVIAATHRDLAAMVREGRFREDLYYRLAVLTVEVPSLRERTEDLPALVTHLVTKYAERDVRVTKAALSVLASAPWPGNVRQLENELRCALVLCDDQLDVEHLSPAIVHPVSPRPGGDSLTLRDQLDALERRLVVDALRRCAGNQTHAARSLGLSRFGLQKMLKRLELPPDGAEGGKRVSPKAPRGRR